MGTPQQPAVSNSSSLTPQEQQPPPSSATPEQKAPSSDVPKAEPGPSPGPSPSSSRPNANTLPPAALDLATKIFNLARTGTTPTLAEYITAGIPPSLTNSSGDTLIMLAAYHGHAQTVSMLIAKGADPNVLNDRGQSPLAGAVFKGHEGVVRVLVREGKADPTVGRPNAVDCGIMFKRGDLLDVMGLTTEGEKKMV